METTASKYRSDQLRCPSDTTHEEWARIEPHLPAARQRGRPRTTDQRLEVDAMSYIAQSGTKGKCRRRIFGERRAWFDR